jgi:hypothetical protein
MTLAPCWLPRGRVQWQAFTRSSSPRGTSTVQRILTYVTGLTRLCLQSLHHRFVAWTTPDTTSLLLLTLTDLTSSKSELVAENALLRQQLIILRRQVKRPACTKTDRMLLVLLARMGRTWKQALFIVQEDDAAALASPGLQAHMEIQVQSHFCHTQDLRCDCGLDSGDGKGQSPSSEQNTSGVNSSSWVFMSANAPLRST